ncbi:MAG: hypothetical protein HN855_14900 [Anaerolineae bacterium]|jgi:hypothetical protein|nr:hypothetical protein [Anaerolineae bacterium]MBT7070790.1 hypothetical protein [Anaerolineae bacterium]MBT7326443.1 hypothetical protein [Anaerolineae bacterium]
MPPSSQELDAPEDNPNKEFFFPDLEELNISKLPPEEVRILKLAAEPYPDGTRVRINLDMTPYQMRPHLDMVLLNPQGKVIADVSIIEPMAWKQEFTVHLREARQDGEYKLAIRLFYPPRDEEDPKLFRLDIPVENTDFKELTFEISEGGA